MVARWCSWSEAPEALEGAGEDGRGLPRGLEGPDAAQGDGGRPLARGRERPWGRHRRIVWPLAYTVTQNLMHCYTHLHKTEPAGGVTRMAGWGHEKIGDILKINLTFN